MRISAIFAAIVGAVSATDFYITSPHSVVSWKAGQQARVTWNILPGGTDVSSVNVDLMDGDDKNAHVLMPIASGLSPQATSVDWTVPADFPSTNTVFIRVLGKGGADPVYRYSHRFAVQGDANVAQLPQQPPLKAQNAADTTQSAQVTKTPFAAAATTDSTSTTDTSTTEGSDTSSSTDTGTDTETTSFTLPTSRTSARNAAAASHNVFASGTLYVLGIMIAVMYLA
jgi:hypothetical protein